MKARLVINCRCLLGEGVLWNHATQTLSWVDIEAGRLYDWDLRGEPTSQKVAEKLGGYVFLEDGSRLLFCEGAKVKKLTGDKVEEVAVAGPNLGRFNDVAATPDGEVLCGTMPHEGKLGVLFRLRVDGTFEVLKEEVGCSNGIGFAPDESFWHFTDSSPRTIVKVPRSGPSQPSPFVTVPEGEGVPDGLCVDSQGGVWSARWGGGCVVRYTPDGEEDLRIEVGASQVTSCAFGGPDLDRLFITTASFDPTEEAGGLFEASVPFTGQKEPFAKVRF